MKPAPDEAGSGISALRIALLVRAMDMGGAQITLQELGRGLAARGHTVCLVALSGAVARRDEKPGDGPGLTHHVLQVRHTRSALGALRRFTSAWQPDVMISALSHTNLLAILCKLVSRRRLAVIVTEHAPIGLLIASMGGWRYRVLPMCIRLLYPWADAIVGVSDGIVTELAGLLPSHPRPIRIYNPIRKPLEATSHQAPLALPWSLDGDTRLVLGVGRLAREKDFATLLHAFARLRMCMKVRLAILGEGPARASLQALAIALGIDEDLHMPGDVADPFPWMRAAGVVALSSRFEGFGNVLVEAMACGTPVVATDAPSGPREITQDGQWGRLVPVGEPLAMADALALTLSEPPDRAALRARAATFSAEAAIAAYEGLAARAASRHDAAMQHRQQKLRIAIYLSDMSGGGAERMKVYLIERFVAAGAEVTLLLHRACGENLADVPACVPVIGFGTSRMAHDIVPLARALRRIRPDILLSSLNHNNVVAAVAARLSGTRTRVIITQHNALSQEAALSGGWKYRVMPLAYRLIAPLVHGIVAVSQGVAEDMARAARIARGRITVIYNPVIDTGFAGRAACRADHPWFAAGEPPVFITAGRLTPQKDHATLLRAFAVHCARAPARLMILGQGPLLANLQDLARSLGIADRVGFVGFQANPLAFYAQAAAFVLSSRYEGFGNVLVEALGCGTPVISTDCPYGPAEILADGRFGTLVRVGDVAAMADAMAEILRNPPDGAVLKARAAEFSSARACERYLDLMGAVRT